MNYAEHRAREDEEEASDFCGPVWPTSAPLGRCAECGKPNVRTSELYVSCPMGHGKLLYKIERDNKGKRDPSYAAATAALKQWTKWLAKEDKWLAQHYPLDLSPSPA